MAKNQITYFLSLFLLGMLCSFMPMELSAQNKGFKATVSQNPVPAGSNFQYSLTLVNQNGRIKQPDFGKLQVVGGPSTSSQTRIVNGRRSSEQSYTWVLRAPAVGKYNIPEAKAQVGSSIITSNNIVLEVTKGTEGVQLKATGDLLVDVELSQRTAYVGEQILAVYKLYSRYPDLRFESIEYPGMDGFWTETLEEEMIDWEPQMKIINGVQYRVAVLKREILYPQRAGTLTIERTELEAMGKRGFFDRYKKMVARSNPVKVEVKPLPAAPEGMVNLGSYEQLSLKVEIDRESLPANEATTLRLGFSGRGNLKLLDNPEIDFPADLEVFDPERSDRISVNSGGMSGSRTFEYVLIPRTAGEYEIPALNLGYFDLGRGEYRRLPSREIILKVSPGSGDGGGGYTYNSKTDVSILNSDIRFIISDAQQLRAVEDRFFGTTAYYGLSILPMLAFLVVWLRKRREQQMQDNPEEWQKRQAGKVARKLLSGAGKLAGKGDAPSFYGELLRAMQGYMGNKFGIAMSELNERVIRERLKDKLEEQLLDEYFDLQREAEMARFANMTGSDEAAALKKAEQVIGAIEKSHRS